MNQDLDGLTPLVRKDDEPTFDDAWQAEVLAIADTLVRSGSVSRQVWAEALGTELTVAEKSGKPDNSDTYYQCVLNAVEHLLHQAKAVSVDELRVRREAWKAAYLRTPHGQPVTLFVPQEEK